MIQTQDFFTPPVEPLELPLLLFNDLIINSLRGTFNPQLLLTKYVLFI